jgi:hypothetical protein
MLDGEDKDGNSDQDSEMPDELHSKISNGTLGMMDQQFAHPTHVSESEDFMGLEEQSTTYLEG